MFQRCIVMSKKTLNCMPHSRKWLREQDTQHLPKVEVMERSRRQRSLAVKFSAHSKKLSVLERGATLLVNIPKEKHFF